jgi:hypothetical protein
MKKRILLIGLVASIWAAGFAPGLVLAGGLRSAPVSGGGAPAPGGGAPAPGGGAPAPEIGASALGLLLASGTALYILRRRQM